MRRKVTRRLCLRQRCCLHRRVCHEQDVLLRVPHLQLSEPLRLLQNCAPGTWLLLEHLHPGVPGVLSAQPAKQDKEQRGHVHPGKHLLQPRQPEPVAHDHPLEGARLMAARLPLVRSHGERQTTDELCVLLLHLPHYLLPLPDGGVWLQAPG